MFDTEQLENSSNLTEPRSPCLFLYGSYCVCYGSGMKKSLLFKYMKFYAFCHFSLTYG